MCVAFGAREIYEFFFSKEDGVPDVYEIDKSTVSYFCSVLEREITAQSRVSPHYKYVFFSLDDQSVERFFGANRNRFLDFGSKVVFAGKSSEEPARLIEQRYNDEIIVNALRKARKQARQKAAKD